MDAREFLGFRCERAVRDHDGRRTVIDRLCRHDLLHGIVADRHVAAKLCLDDLLRIIAHDDEVAALVARLPYQLRGVAVPLVQSLQESLEAGAVEVVEASRGDAVYRLEREVPFALIDEPAESRARPRSKLSRSDLVLRPLAGKEK